MFWMTVKLTYNHLIFLSVFYEYDKCAYNAVECSYKKIRYILSLSYEIADYMQIPGKPNFDLIKQKDR